MNLVYTVTLKVEEIVDTTCMFSYKYTYRYHTFTMNITGLSLYFLIDRLL